MSLGVEYAAAQASCPNVYPEGPGRYVLRQLAGASTSADPGYTAIFSTLVEVGLECFSARAGLPVPSGSVDVNLMSLNTLQGK